jgi:hypothetical protein
MKLLDKIIFTDTVEDDDTISICPSILQDPKVFYTIGEQLAGSNFLKTPYTVNLKMRYGEKKVGMFSTHTPPWLNVKQLNSLAKLVLFYLERALWFQYESHCLQPFRHE